MNYPDQIREAEDLLVHYLGQAGVLSNEDCDNEVRDIVRLIFEAAVKEATRQILEPTS